MKSNNNFVIKMLGSEEANKYTNQPVTFVSKLWARVLLFE